MILANMRKEGSTASRARVQDFAQWPISTAVQPVSIWLELPKSMCSGRMQTCRFLVERPNKNSLPGVAVLQNHFSSYQSALVQCNNIPG